MRTPSSLAFVPFDRDICIRMDSTDTHTHSRRSFCPRPFRWSRTRGVRVEQFARRACVDCYSVCACLHGWIMICATIQTIKTKKICEVDHIALGLDVFIGAVIRVLNVVILFTSFSWRSYIFSIIKICYSLLTLFMIHKNNKFIQIEVLILSIC